MQEQGEAKREEKQAPMGPQVVYCPICGEPMGPWGMGHHHHHGGPWAGPGPWAMRRWGMGPMAWRWGGGGPWGMASCGVLPALLGFAIGYMVASARTSAWWAWKESKAHR